jgi:hypothetical protein
VDIFGVYIPRGLDVTAMLKGFLSAADDLDSERQRRMFLALLGGAVIEQEERLVALQHRLDAAGRDE